MPGADDKDEQQKTTPWGTDKVATPQKTTPWGTDPTPTPSQATPGATERVVTPSRTTQPAPTEPTAGDELLTGGEVPEALRERYDLLAELGRGGMGIVYRARDRETGDVVALKVLQPEIAAQPELIERFKAELLLARKITHPNVCRVYELLRFGGTVVISMEFIEGQNLRSILAHYGPLSVRRGLEWARQICAGVGAAHAQGVVHRDLKPENIVVAREGTVKVMDFGIARSVEARTTQSGVVMGTPAYMSPEQAQGLPADARSDIYSVGLIFYEMFSGRVAFQGDSAIALVARQVNEMPPAPREVEPYVPGFLSRAIQKCLEKNPKRRFQSLADLEKSLSETAAPSAAEQAEEVYLPDHLTRWQRWDTYLLAGAALALGLFYFLFRGAYPYAPWEPRVSVQQATDNVLGVVRKIHPAGELVIHDRVFPRLELWNYERSVLAVGLPEANRLHQEHSWKWVIDLEVRVDGKRIPGYVRLDRDGRLESVAWKSPRAAGSEKAPTREELQEKATQYVPGICVQNCGTTGELQEKATQYVRQLFAADLTGAPASVQPGASAEEMRVAWRLPRTAAGPEQVLTATVGPEGLRRAERRPASGPESVVAGRESESWRRAAAHSAFGLNLLGVLAGFMLALFFLRRLFKGTHRSALYFTCLAMGAGISLYFFSGMMEAPLPAWMEDKLPEFDPAALYMIGAMGVARNPRFMEPISALVAGGGFAFLAIYAVLVLTEHYLRRSLPGQLASWQLLQRDHVKARPAGLSLVRGCMLGAIYLGVHTLIVWGLGRSKLGGPGTAWLQVAENKYNLILFATMLAVLVTVLAAWCLVAFPAALAYRVRARALLPVVVTAALWMLTGFTLPGASAFPLLPLLLLAGLQGAFFAAVLYQYDVLAALAAIFTVETGLLVIPVFVIFSEVVPLAAATGLLPWMVLLGLGLTIFLWPQLREGWRRAAAVLD